MNDEDQIKTLKKELAYYKRQLDHSAGISLNDQYALAQSSYDCAQQMKAFAIIADIQQTFNAFAPLDELYINVLEAIHTHLSEHKVMMLDIDIGKLSMRPYLWKGYNHSETIKLNDFSLELSSEFVTERKTILANGFKELSPFEVQLQDLIGSSYFILTPLIVADRFWGALVTARNYKKLVMSYQPYTQSSINVLNSIGGVVSACQLQAEKVSQIEKERLRIARDMHDDIGSELSRISITCEDILGKSVSTPALEEQLRFIQKSSGQLIDNIGNIIWALNPINNSMISLLGYIREFSVEYLELNKFLFIYTATELNVDIPVNNDTRIQVFRVIKESLHNIVKHSKATLVKIDIKIENSKLLCSIVDNGKGFLLEEQKRGNGLRNIKQRITESNGELTIKSEFDKGTSVEFNVPLM